MNKLVKINVLLLILMLGMSARAQVADTQLGNYVEILPTDSKDEIIRKAANVTPSAKQMAWQEMELTAFLHFGINTFTNREWGDGKENPKLFNPKRLDAGQWPKNA